MEKVRIDLGFAVLTAEANFGVESCPQISVYLEKDNGCVFQDIVLIESDLTKKMNERKVAVYVYADCGTEDYTDKFVINQVKE